jgi:hypothetical protein
MTLPTLFVVTPNSEANSNSFPTSGYRHDYAERRDIVKNDRQGRASSAQR